MVLHVCNSSPHKAEAGRVWDSDQLGLQSKTLPVSKKKSFSSSRASVFQEAMVEVLSGDLFFGILLGAL
jgi:hypothetical protein